jgi:hypothetical protein
MKGGGAKSILCPSPLEQPPNLMPSSPFLPPKQTRAKGVVSMVQSKALPFLEAPKKLDGSLVGDFGFDPMGE